MKYKKYLILTIFFLLFTSIAFSTNPATTISVRALNVNPVLSNGNVTPSIGMLGDDFVFNVTYKDNNADPPANVYVFMNGDFHTMTFLYGDYYTGANYSYTWTSDLSGNVTYYFRAVDVNLGEDRLPAVGTYNFTVIECYNATDCPGNYCVDNDVYSYNCIDHECIPYDTQQPCFPLPTFIGTSLIPLIIVSGSVIANARLWLKKKWHPNKLIMLTIAEVIATYVIFAFISALPQWTP